MTKFREVHVHVRAIRFVNNCMSDISRGDYSDSSHECDSERFSIASQNDLKVSSRFLPPLLAEEACEYCSCSELESLVRCLVCERWFCNGASDRCSHAIHHATKSGHKEFCIQGVRLCCSTCGNGNIFILGSLSNGFDPFEICCRDPCLSKALDSIGQSDLINDPSVWVPLISERKFRQVVVASPRDDINVVSFDNMARLEEKWSIGESRITMDDIIRSKGTKFGSKKHKIPRRFESHDTYSNFFSDLVKSAADSDRQKCEQIVYEVDSFRMDKAPYGGCACYFQIPSEARKHIRLGVSLKLFDSGDLNWQGDVMSVKKNSVCLHIPATKKLPLGDKYSVQLVWNSITYDRMKEAIIRLGKPGLISPKIRDILLNGSLSPAVSCASTFKQYPSAFGNANASQQRAIDLAFKQPLTLIQGPPGSGKTYTSAKIIFRMTLENKAVRSPPVLVCTPSNCSIENIALLLGKAQVNLVIVTSRSREGIPCPGSKYHLSQLCLKDDAKLKKMTLERLTRSFSPSEEFAFKNLRKSVELKILKSADVICCTCSVAGDLRLSDFCFENVLIDEITQAQEPEALIPLTLGAKRVVLVGDQCQLGPTVCDEKLSKKGLGKSLFDRLLSLKLNCIMLDTQYRMHPSIADFPSKEFYHSKLFNGISEQDRDNRKIAAFPWPTSKPLCFIDTAGKEEVGPNGTSYLNRFEAEEVVRVLKKLFALGVKQEQIGVISFYDGQRCYLESLIQRSIGNLSNLDVNSVDAFQGREKDVIVLTCVRANSSGDLDFISHRRRLNVALTRARYGLVICGNARTLQFRAKKGKESVWNSLLLSFQKQRLIVKGPL